MDILDGRTGSTPLHEVYGYKPGMGLPSAADRGKMVRLMTVRERRQLGAPFPVRRRLTGGQSWAVSTGRTCAISSPNRAPEDADARASGDARASAG